MTSIMINESIQCRQMRVKKANSLRQKKEKLTASTSKTLTSLGIIRRKNLKKWAKDVICGGQTSTTTLLYSLFSTIKKLQTQTYMQHMAGNCKQYHQPTYPFFCFFFFSLTYLLHNYILPVNTMLSFSSRWDRFSSSTWLSHAIDDTFRCELLNYIYLWTSL